MDSGLKAVTQGFYKFNLKETIRKKMEIKHEKIRKHLLISIIRF